MQNKGIPEITVHCLFCGEVCYEEKDKKNPGRWRPVSRCRTADSDHCGMKKAILQVCKERNYAWIQTETNFGHQLRSLTCTQTLMEQNYSGGHLLKQFQSILVIRYWFYLAKVLRH